LKGGGSSGFKELLFLVEKEKKASRENLVEIGKNYRRGRGTKIHK